jgi:hypothetical protein
MPTSSTLDRRGSDRRHRALVPEAIERRRQRRAEDRRDSVRVRVRLEVREGEGRFEERIGNLGIEGAYFESPVRAWAGPLELRFPVLGTHRQVTAAARIVGVSLLASGDLGLHCQFIDLPAMDQFALARVLGAV